MMKTIPAKLLCLGFLVSLAACSKDDENSVAVIEASGDGYIAQEFFNTAALISTQTISGTLEDGTTAECLQLTFSSNPVADGPYCPATVSDVGGVGVYDGATNAGFQVMKADLFNAMENDGYDIIDDDGNIRIDDFQAGPTVAEFSYCLAAAPNDNLTLTFTIPAVPKLAASNNDIGTVEFVGVSVDGVPIAGDPPSVANPEREVAGNIPSIDPCGGHPDPAGYYHLHFIPEVMNKVLDSYSITEISCTNYAQTESMKLSGFAKDGFPIYAYATVPTDLDDCGGRTAATDEFPNGIYHYVASTTVAPNIPQCLKGVAAQNSFTYN